MNYISKQNTNASSYDTQRVCAPRRRHGRGFRLRRRAGPRRRRFERHGVGANREVDPSSRYGCYDLEKPATITFHS